MASRSGAASNIEGVTHAASFSVDVSGVLSVRRQWSGAGYDDGLRVSEPVDILVTDPSMQSSTSTFCVHHTIAPAGVDTPERCHKLEECSDDAVSCKPRSYSVKLTVFGCGAQQTTCCSASRTTPYGVGCLDIQQGGVSVGTRCAGERITKTLSVPGGLACDDKGDVTKKLSAVCSADNGLRFEISAIFRCRQCKAKKDDSAR